MEKKLWEVIANQCAPVLADVKPSNLLILTSEEEEVFLQMEELPHISSLCLYEGKTKAPGFCTGEIVWNRHLYGPRQENFWNSMDTGWFGKVWMRSFYGFSTDSRSIKKNGSHFPMRWVCFWDIRWEM